MERIPIEPGRVVRSLQGRDEGRWFVVLSTSGDGFALMADGLTRKLSHPKKKKFKHLRPKPVRMENIADPHLLDSDVRKFLQANGFGIEQPLCKED